MKFNLIVVFLLFCSSTSFAQTKYFNSFDDTKIAYTDEGEGKPILLVHGFLNTRKSWNNTALKKDLLAKGYRVIVPDLRGNGDSDKPQDDEAYAKNAEVMDLLFLMSDLKIAKYNAVGYSRGSIVLAKLLTQTARIKKAILGGMGIDFTNANWQRRKLFSKAFNGQVTAETKGAVEYAKLINADFRSLHLQQKHQPVTSKRQLKLIQAKVLVLVGDEDKDNGDPKLLSEAILKSKFKEVEGDHNGTYKTKAFSEAILSFF